MRLRQLISVGLVLAVSGCSTLASQAISGGAAPPAAKITRASTSGTLTTLYSFRGQPDGANPQGAADAITTCASQCVTTIYGNTTSGGTNGAGTIYALGHFVREGEKVLLSYAPSQTGTNPTGAVVGPDGGAGLFGTASRGGLDGKGTVVDLYGDLRSTFSIRVFSFDGHNGASPVGLIRSSVDRKIHYAAAFAGGRHHRGTIASFRISRQKLVTKVLYSFSGNADGEHPNSTLTTDGFGGTPYYGTTAGSNRMSGTVYVFAPAHGLTTLYDFKSSSDGVTPTGVFPLGDSTKNNRLFGTTLKGGSSGYGTLYELEPNGSTYTKTTLHTFTGGSGDGSFPQGPLAVNASTGILYGVTKGGGSGGCGTIFSVDPSSGNYRSLYSFTCGDDGAYPEAPLANSLGSNLLYGTTSAGGTFNKGVVFTYKP